MLLDSPPTTIDGWVQKAITVDSQYRMTMDILGGMSKKTDNKGGRFKDTRKTNYLDYFKTRKYRDEKKDDNAMDIDAMSTEKRITLMKKGACFICEKPGHMARDHDEYVKKNRKERRRKTMMRIFKLEDCLDVSASYYSIYCQLFSSSS